MPYPNKLQQCKLASPRAFPLSNEDLNQLILTRGGLPWRTEAASIAVFCSSRSVKNFTLFERACMSSEIFLKTWSCRISVSIPSTGVCWSSPKFPESLFIEPNEWCEFWKGLQVISNCVTVDKINWQCVQNRTKDSFSLRTALRCLLNIFTLV